MVTETAMVVQSPFTDDFFKDRGVDLPCHLATKKRRWISLLICVVFNAFASGPIASWQTLVPILTSEGVFAGPNQASDLTNVYTLATSAGMCAYLLAGILYDAVGPRAMASTSAFLVMICLIVMGVAISIPSLNYLLWYAYPLATALGYMNNMAGYAWLYLLPDHQGAVASITGAIQVLADAFILIAVLLHDKFGLSLSFYFYLCAVLSFIAGICCLVMIPTHALNHKIVRAVQKFTMGADVESSSYGAADSSIKEDFDEVESFWDVVKRCLIALKDACICCLGINPVATVIYVLLYSPMIYMFAMYPELVLYQFYKSFLGAAKATELVNMWGGLYASIGTIGLLVFGYISDYVTFRTVYATLGVCVIANMICFSVPLFSIQVVGQVISALWMNVSYYLLGPKFCLSYVPPELYGSMMGIIGLVMGVGEMILMPLGIRYGAIVEHALPLQPSAYLGYLVIIGLYFVGTIFFGICFFLFTYFYPMPNAGSITMGDVRRVCGSADEDDNPKPIATQDVPPAGNKSSTPTCAACEWICKPTRS